MKKFDIVTSRTYMKDGVEKKIWNNVGTLVQFPPSGDKKEGFKLELNMFPTTQFSVFEQKPREKKPEATPEDQQFIQSQESQAPVEPVITYPEENINPEEIPF